MKKTILTILLLVFFVTSCIAFTACHQHYYNEVVVIKNATCVEDGLQQKICNCGDSKAEIIRATGHNYKNSIVEHTCTTQGYTTHICENCGDSYTDAVLEPTGHNYLETVTEPTCTQSGYTIHTCENCGDSYQDNYMEVVVCKDDDGNFECDWCGNLVLPEVETTEEIVALASKMSLAELEAAAKAEMEASDDTFKVVGLTSVLKKASDAFKAKYEWIGDKMNVNNSYKDYALLQALETAGTSYFADYALVQDVRSIAAFDGDLLHNFVPSDYEGLGLVEADTKPLKGIYFNKLFYTNTNFENVTGKKLYNIWQLAGSEADADHLGLVSFLPATTEQINMSFLLSCEDPANQARIEDAYRKYYGKNWASDTYESAGQQWVTEFIANISRWHSSDGTAMKETQLKNDWTAGYVYYGAFAKMKDAVGKYYTIADIEGALANDPILKDLIETEGENAGKINAMKTVKWDWEIEGFNGFMYAMYSQIVNNAKHPYTACLYARFLLTLDAYESSVYNKDLPKPDGSTASKVNPYGYYAPASNNITYAKGDWTRDQHIAKEIVENYEYLKTVRITQVNRILGLIASNEKAN